MTLEEKRINEDFKWLVKNTKKIQKKNAGMVIAIVNKKIAGTGKTAKIAYKKAKLKFPDKEPLMDVVPDKNFLFL